jgi:hypothetical protein
MPFCVYTDQVAVPDYPSGATEHWGLITYRESRLLYDPNQVGDYDKQRVATIVSHELLHNVSITAFLLRLSTSAISPVLWECHYVSVVGRNLAERRIRQTLRSAWGRCV